MSQSVGSDAWLAGILNGYVAFQLSDGTVLPKRKTIVLDTSLVASDDPTNEVTRLSAANHFAVATDVRDYGVDLTGATSAVADLSAAHVAALAKGGDLVHYPAGSYKIDSNYTFPAGLRHHFAPGAVLEISSGIQATFAGPIDASPTAAIFAGAGTLAGQQTVVFAPGSQPHVWADWWATTVGASTCPVQSACDAAHPARIPVFLNSDAYPLATGSVGLSITNPYATIKCHQAPVSDQSSITGATDASPIVLTLGGSGLIYPYAVGQKVFVAGVGGNTAANGVQTVGAFSGTSLTLAGTTGNAAYTSGGVIQPLSGAILQYSSNGTAVQIGQSVGTSANFIEGLDLENVRVSCVDSTSIGIRVWCPLRSTFKKVHVYGLSGSSSVACQIEGSVAFRLSSCDFQAQGSASSASNYGTCVKVLAAAGSTSTTTTLDDCYLHYGSVGLLVDTSFVNVNNGVIESCTRGFQAQNSGDIRFSKTWFENVGGPATAGELFGSLDATSFVTLEDTTQNVAGDCRKMFTTAAGCKLRIRGGRVLGGVGDYVIFYGSEICHVVAGVAELPTSDVKVSGWSLEGSGGVYNSTDSRAATGEFPTWKTVMWTDLAVTRYDFYQSSVPANQAETGLTAAGCPGAGYQIAGDPLNTASGGGRILGLVWSYDGPIVAGTFRIRVYQDGSVVLDTGTLTIDSSNPTGTVDLSCLSSPTDPTKTLACTLTTSSGFANTGGLMSVQVYVGYGNVVGA